MTQEISAIPPSEDVVADLVGRNGSLQVALQSETERANLAEANFAQSSAAFSEVLTDLKKALNFANRFRKQRNAHALLNVAAIAILVWHWLS